MALSLSLGNLRGRRGRGGPQKGVFCRAVWRTRGRWKAGLAALPALASEAAPPRATAPCAPAPEAGPRGERRVNHTPAWPPSRCTLCGWEAACGMQCLPRGFSRAAGSDTRMSRAPGGRAHGILIRPPQRGAGEAGPAPSLAPSGGHPGTPRRLCRCYCRPWPVPKLLKTRQGLLAVLPTPEGWRAVSTAAQPAAPSLAFLSRSPEAL